MAKRENISNRHAQEQVNKVAEFISAYGIEGVAENYIIAYYQYHHGVDPRKTRQYLSTLIWMDRIRREVGPEERVLSREKRGEIRYYTTNTETFKQSEQTDLEGQPTTTVESGEGTVFDIIARAHTTSPKVVNPKEAAEK